MPNQGKRRISKECKATPSSCNYCNVCWRSVILKQWKTFKLQKKENIKEQRREKLWAFLSVVFWYIPSVPILTSDGLTVLKMITPIHPRILLADAVCLNVFGLIVPLYTLHFRLRIKVVDPCLFLNHDSFLKNFLGRTESLPKLPGNIQPSQLLVLCQHF